MTRFIHRGACTVGHRENDLTSGWIVVWVQHGARAMLRYPSKGLFFPAFRTIWFAGVIFFK